MTSHSIPFVLIMTTLLLFSCGRKQQETRPFRKDVTEMVFASGVLEAKNTYSLTAQVTGYLTDIHFSEGDIVSTDQVLAHIDNRENVYNLQSAQQLYRIAESNTKLSAPALSSAMNTVRSAKTQMQQDKLQFERYSKLLEQKSVSRLEYENMRLQYSNSSVEYENALESYKQAKQQAEQELVSARAQAKVDQTLTGYNSVRATYPGKVYKKYKEIGDFVKQGDVIALIGDPKELYANVNVDESNIAKVKIGQKALVELNTQKRKIYEGVVQEIHPFFDETTQSFIVKIQLSTRLDFQISNTQLQANIIVSESKDALLIPRDFLDYGGTVQIKGKSGRTAVKTKFVSNDYVQVLSGIDENTVLVAEDAGEKKGEGNSEIQVP